MKTVTTLLLKQGDKVASPPFPDACCYCGNSAGDTIQTKVGEVELSIPYCEQHLAPAGEYVEKVIPRFVAAQLIYCGLGGVAMAVAAPLIFEVSGFVRQILVGIVGFIAGFFLLMLGGGDLWTRWILKRGAERRGFTGRDKIAPGITGASARQEPGSAKVRLDLAFADEAYADLFEARQQATDSADEA